MALANEKRRVNNRVSESTLNRMRMFTGSSVQQVRDVEFEVVVDGHPYKILIDKQGKASIVGKIK